MPHLLVFVTDIMVIVVDSWSSVGQVIGLVDTLAATALPLGW